MAEHEEKTTLPVWVGWIRLAIGLAQGYGLYLVNDMKHDPTTALVQALFITLLFAPLVVIGGLGAMRRLTLAVWSVCAVLIAAGFGWYDVDRVGDMPRGYGPQFVFIIVPVVLFVGHHLVQAGDEARRWLAPYERYFDLGWRHGAQLLLALLFTGAFWAILGLGGALFNLIGVRFIGELIQKPWFAYPATFTMFAAAIHLTDLRSGLVRGARALGLMLLSWLLPAMTVLAAAFLLTLPFTGLQPLWNTRAATSILLNSAAALVVLINAAYQDNTNPPGFIRFWSARIAAILLTPLAALAAYALYLRIEQYGLTPERVYGAAALTIGGCYAVSYAIGAFWPRWMKPLEIGNIISAYVFLAFALLLFTPIADPARLSVNDQLARLHSGRITPQRFDVSFLRFDGARYGQEALQRLSADHSTPAATALATRASAVMGMTGRWQDNPSQQPLPPMQIVMHPATAQLPRGFEDNSNYGLSAMCRRSQCDGFFLDLDNDGRNELIVGQNLFFAYSQQSDGKWRQIASFDLNQDQVDAFRAGRARAVPAELSDLMVGEQRIPVRRLDPPGG